MELTQLIDRLHGVKQLPSGYAARCPAHDDRVASLSFNIGSSGGIVLHCHAGCSPAQVLGALGMSLAELSPDPHVVATYDYVDEQGSLRYQVQRWMPKDFRCLPGLPEPIYRVLYNMPAIQWARQNNQPLYIVEGEKDCERLAARGIPATCNVGGAGIGKWLPQYTETVAGLHVIIVADNDEPGREHARAIANAIRDRVATLRLTRCKYGNDISAALDAGYTVEDTLDDLSLAEDIGWFTASDVATKAVHWLWPGYLPRGKVTIIDGDPGEGKSILTLDLAARFTTGAPMPDGAANLGPMDVLLVLAEDDMADTVKPRLIAAGADLDRVHCISSGATARQPFEFDTGLPGLEAKLARHPVGVVVFDPVMAFIAPATNTNNDASVRRALFALRAFAQDANVAVILVRHLNKGGNGAGKVMYRGGGSIGFIGLARVGHLVTRSADDPALRLLAPVKNNLSPLAPTLSYRIEASPAGLPFLRWQGAVDITAQLALEQSEMPASDGDAPAPELVVTRRARQLERGFLADVLAEESKTWAEIVATGRDHGFTEASLRRARADLDLTKIVDPERGTAGIRWALPGPVVPSPPPTYSPQDAEDDDTRDSDLMALPLECGICRGTSHVNRYAAPYWVVRCRSHDPRQYADSGDAP